MGSTAGVEGQDHGSVLEGDPIQALKLGEQDLVEVAEAVVRPIEEQ
jgi:hypothetical protein